MLRLSIYKRKFADHLKSVSFVSNVAHSGIENNEVHNKGHDGHDKGHVMSFEEIPGPKSYPIVGTLYKYVPYIGKFSVKVNIYLTTCSMVIFFSVKHYIYRIQRYIFIHSYHTYT